MGKVSVFKVYSTASLYIYFPGTDEVEYNWSFARPLFIFKAFYRAVSRILPGCMELEKKSWYHFNFTQTSVPLLLDLVPSHIIQENPLTTCNRVYRRLNPREIFSITPADDRRQHFFIFSLEFMPFSTHSTSYIHSFSQNTHTRARVGGPFTGVFCMSRSIYYFPLRGFPIFFLGSFLQVAVR